MRTVPWKSSFVFLLAFFTLSCARDVVLQTKEELQKYTINGYLSSRKDQASFDVVIKVDLEADFYEIRGNDTLLGKERFVLRFRDGNWMVQNPQEDSRFHRVDPQKKLVDILPPPAVFNYRAFLEGRVPVLKDSTPVREKNILVYRSSNFRQIIEFEKGRQIKEMSFFYDGERVYKIVYENYVFAGERIFPKQMEIIDYENRRVIKWWLSTIHIQ
jgi:hypothetical protein